MGDVVRIIAPDGFQFAAYHAQPTDARRGGLVVLHAIWGATPHIRALCDSYAADGYEVIAPSLADRVDPRWPEVDVDPAHLPVREAWADNVGWGAGCMGDVQATIDALAPKGSVFVMGFCFGGTTTWLAACRLEVVAAGACFYGGQILLYKDETPKCPTILHFGKADPLIPPVDREAIMAAHPDIPAYLYDAGHAFVAPNAYHADSARLARLRGHKVAQKAGSMGNALGRIKDWFVGNF